ncbi:hypothetical protein [Emticicia sp.]|uniref:hypothetical protein n=1 Tax=Emticicia sp. TaxID=1930953 RepID=UPI00375000ED
MAVQWLNKALSFVSSLVLRNRHLRKAATWDLALLGRSNGLLLGFGSSRSLSI